MLYKLLPSSLEDVYRFILLHLAQTLGHSEFNAQYSIAFCGGGFGDTLEDTRGYTEPA